MSKIKTKDIKKDSPKLVDETSKDYVKRLVKELFGKDIDDTWLMEKPPK